MATSETIAYVIAQAASHCAYTSEQDRTIRAEEFARHFGGTNDDKLMDAVERWCERTDSNDPPRVLPNPAAIWALMPRQTTEPTKEAGDIGYQRPRAHVVAAAHDIAERVRRLGLGARSLDEHLAARDRGVPAHELAGLKAALASLPEPEPPTRLKHCLCDGSGWVDVHLTNYQPAPTPADPYERAVYPCKRCNSKQFYAEEWDAYFGRSRSEAEAAQAADKPSTKTEKPK